MRRLVYCWIVLLVIVGCGGDELDPTTTALRTKYLVTAEPPQPISLTAVAELLTSHAEDAVPLPVVVVGRIHAGDLQPWEPGKASFVLSELPAAGHGEGHDADNCPFCKRRAAQAPTGVVRFVDDNNETIAVDARKLFGVQQEQTVVVQGKASLGAFNSVVLIADRMFLPASR